MFWNNDQDIKYRIKEIIPHNGENIFIIESYTRRHGWKTSGTQYITYEKALTIINIIKQTQAAKIKPDDIKDYIIHKIE